MFFLTSWRPFCRDQKAPKPFRRASKASFPHFFHNFLTPDFRRFSIDSAISACQILLSLKLFLFLRKKVCCAFGCKGILFYFCTRFPALMRLVEHLKSDLWKNSIDFYAEEAERVSIRECLGIYWDCYSVSSMFSCKREVQESSNSFFTFNSLNQKKKKWDIQCRVWSWLRMNASYRLNTCKSWGSGYLAC